MQTDVKGIFQNMTSRVLACFKVDTIYELVSQNMFNVIVKLLYDIEYVSLSPKQ